MSPYKNVCCKRAYTRGYEAGARRIVLAYLGERCQNCGSTKNLEIAHDPPINKKWRDYTDWLNKDELKILCVICNQREENGRR